MSQLTRLTPGQKRIATVEYDRAFGWLFMGTVSCSVSSLVKANHLRCFHIFRAAGPGELIPHRQSSESFFLLGAQPWFSLLADTGG